MNGIDSITQPNCPSQLPNPLSRSVIPRVTGDFPLPKYLKGWCPMSTNKRIYNRFQPYLEDTQCRYCLYFQSQKLGCSLDQCCCEAEKVDAIVNGRIKRKRGDIHWPIRKPRPTCTGKSDWCSWLCSTVRSRRGKERGKRLSQKRPPFFGNQKRKMAMVQPRIIWKNRAWLSYRSERLSPCRCCMLFVERESWRQRWQKQRR